MPARAPDGVLALLGSVLVQPMEDSFGLRYFHPMPRAPDFSSLSVLVVGDLIADHWLYAQPVQLSDEAPVLVLRHERERVGAGGAANVARNLRALGADVSVLGAIGRDANGRELLNLIESEGIDTSGVELVPGALTPTRTRILAAEPHRAPQQVLRIDRDPAQALDAEVRARVAARAYALGEHVDAILVSDHGYGNAGPQVGAVAAELARTGKIAVLDPRSSIEGFGGLTAMTLNVAELAHLLFAAGSTHSARSAPSVRPSQPASSAPSATLVGTAEPSSNGLDDPAALRIAAEDLLGRVACRFLLLTRGSLGMALFGEGLLEGGVAVEASGSGSISDVCGAGDSAAAVFTLALAAGLTATDAMVIANAACGVVVREHGTAVCKPAQLAGAVTTAPSAIAARLHPAG